MVLICNNNILTIEKFHENRKREKSEIQYIILNEEKIREKYKEKPEKPREINNSYIKSTEGLSMKTNKSINLNYTKK
jgi:hypothetical protein